MSREKKRYLFAGILSILLILSAYKYFNEFTITPSKAASAVMREVSNDNRIYHVTEEQMKILEDLYKSAEKFSLPRFEVTKVISLKNNEFLERVIFKKDPLSKKWIIVPKKMGDSDSSYINRNSIGNYLLQDIKFESEEDENLKGLFKVITQINYSEFDEGNIRKKYTGWVTFGLKKLSLNQWSVEEVYVVSFMEENI